MKNISLSFSPVTNINNWRVKSALSNAVSLIYTYTHVIYLFCVYALNDAAISSIVVASRSITCPTLPHFEVLQNRRSTFPSFKNGVDPWILRLLICERVGRVDSFPPKNDGSIHVTHTRSSSSLSAYYPTEHCTILELWNPFIDGSLLQKFVEKQISRL